MGSSGGTYEQGYQKGYYRGKKTGERKAKRERPLGADKQQKSLDNALRRLRKP